MRRACVAIGSHVGKDFEFSKTAVQQGYFIFSLSVSAMATRRRDLATQSEVRRSPRLTSRLAKLLEDGSHPLEHHEVYSRPSLGTGRGRGRGRGRTGRRTRSKSRSRSATPNTILNESGQTVPAAFEASGSPTGEGEPRHLFGLDTVSDEIEVEYRDSGPPGSGCEPTHWNVYNNERIVITQTPPRAHQSPGCCARISNFFTALLFKLGSFLYLAATGILCLDVIVLHRLFNFGSISQRAGSISRFFLLLLVLFALVGFLIGSQLFPAEPDPASKVNVSETRLKSLVTSISKSLELKMASDFETFEARFMRDLDDHITALVKSDITKLSYDQKDKFLAEAEKQNKAMLQLREDIMIELDSFRDRQLSEIKALVESRVSEIPGRLEDLKNSLEPQINDLRDGQNDLMQAVRQKLDTLAQKQEGLVVNMTILQLALDRQEGQISRVEEKLRDVVMEMATFKSNYLHRMNATENPSVAEDKVVEIFDQELEKAISNKDSPLRLWLDLVFASKNDLRGIHKSIDDLIRSGGVGGSGDLTRKDVADMIALSLRRYSADRIGRFDFALESSGGSIMLSKCSSTYSRTLTSVSLFGVIPLWSYISTPKVIIRPSIYPGDCWAMEGQQGHATIKLRDEVVITGVTIDHIPQELSPSNDTLDTTPKDFAVVGLKSLTEDGVQLGRFMYNLDGTPIQEFNIPEKMRTSSFHYARFEFLSNYGNQNYTCVYRVRVHGHRP